MKMHSVANVVERQGTVQDKQFTIKASAGAFQILSSGLYSDKPLAICRELMANCVDSHKEAGTSDIPFELKLPNSFDNIFRLTDYGTGLSHEKIMTLYTTLFDSTKTDSDEYIGQLGLGSKTPYSYTDNFLVESRYNGTLSIYSCYKDEDGLPSIAVMGVVDTIERNGLTISFAVENNDFSRFATAAKTALQYYDKLPTIIGATIDITPIEYRIEGDGWAIRKTNYNSGVRVVQGGVAYPVDMYLMGREHEPLKALQSINADLFVPIGDVDVAPSREALQYNKRTIARLNEILSDMLGNLVKELQDQLDACSSEWDQRILFDSWWHTSNDYAYQQLFRNSFAQFLTIGGVKASTNVKVNPDNVNLNMWNCTSVGTSAKKNKDVITSIPVNGKVLVCVFRDYRGIKAVVDSILYNKYQTRVLAISPYKGETYNQADIDDMLKQLGNPPLYDHSKHVPIKVKSTYVARDKNMRLVWSGFNSTGYTQSHVCWHRREIDLADGGVYVETHRCKAETKDRRFFDWIMAGKAAEILPTIIGLTEAECKKVENSSNWVELSDYMKEQFELMNANDYMYKISGRHSGACNIGQGHVTGFASVFNKIKDDITNLKLVSSAEILCNKDIFNMVTGVQNSLERIKGIHDKFVDAEMKISQYRTQYINDWNDMMNGVPMLRCIDWDRVSEDNQKLIIDYINNQVLINDNV